MPYDYGDDLLHFSSVLCCLSLVSYLYRQRRDFKDETTNWDVQKLVHIPLRLNLLNKTPPLSDCRNVKLTEIEMLQD